MNKYDRYLINFQSELLGNALLPDPVIFFMMKFDKIGREWRRALKMRCTKSGPRPKNVSAKSLGTG